MTNLCPIPTARAYRGVSMSLEDRIKGVSVACNPSGESMRHKAATIAAEADELMREMAASLDAVLGMYIIRHSGEALYSDECHTACEVLERYEEYTQ